MYSLNGSFYPVILTTEFSAADSLDSRILALILNLKRIKTINNTITTPLTPIATKETIQANSHSRSLSSSSSELLSLDELELELESSTSPSFSSSTSTY